MKGISLATVTQAILQTLGSMIKVARKERKMSQADLAQRISISRYTLMAIEKGDPKVAIGAVFEAAYIVGIPLLAENKEQLATLNKNLAHITSLLPQRIKKGHEFLDDNF